MTTIRNYISAARGPALLVFAALALASCETTGDSPGPAAQAAPAEPAMTHARAAEECWMKTEKGHSDIDLDKRADIVTKCIDDKMNGGPGAKG